MEKKNVMRGVFGVMLLIGIAGAIVVSILCYLELRTLRKDYEKMAQEMSTDTTEMLEKREDGIKIAEEYTVESTIPVSDAYISGDSSKLTDAEKETLDMAKTVIKENVKDKMTDYEKEKAIYEWMVKNIANGTGMLTVIPQTSQENASPHGVLKNHNAVCVGYATTFRLFMQMLGIQCKVVHNKDMYHTWDLVKLENDWYHVDIYTDAGGARYSNFNISDTMMSSNGNGEWNREAFPKAEGIKYNYAYQNKENCNNLYDIPQLIRKAMKDNKYVLMIDFKKALSREEQAIATGIINGVESVMNNADIDATKGISFGTYNWMQDPETQSYLFCMNLSHASDQNIASSISKKEIKKIIKAISKSFGDLGEPDPSMINGGEEGDM